MLGSTEFTLGPLRVRFSPLIAIAIAITVTSLVRLGLWQMDRAEEKMQLQAAWDQRQEASPTAIEQTNLADLDALKNLKVSLTGHYLNDSNFLIGNRVYHGRFGYEVITPFSLASNNNVVFVSRGWIEGLPDRQVLPDIPAVEGPVSLTATINVPHKQTFYRPVKPDGNWPQVISFFDAPTAAEYLKRNFYPYPVRLDEDAPGVLTRPWPKPKLKASNSQSYAMQWFSMAFAVVLVTLYFSTNIRELWQ